MDIETLVDVQFHVASALNRNLSSIPRGELSGYIKATEICTNKIRALVTAARRAAANDMPMLTPGG